MAKNGLTFTVSIKGITETLAKFKELPKEASKELRTETLKLSEDLASSARRAALAEGKQAALMAVTVKARKDRVPSVQAGGATRVGRYKKPAYALLFGSEFGMNTPSGWFAKPRYASDTGYQYHPHTGQQGAWFFPTVEREAPRIAEAWNRVADNIVRRFGE